jgi:hypothetical protein
MGLLIAVVAIAGIVVVGLSYIYTSSQGSPRGMGVIGEATVHDLKAQPMN